MPFVNIPINAGRVCDGLGKIGYTPASAITDIADNAVQASASNIWINIIPEQAAPTTRKNNVKEYLIIDDGNGMNFDMMKEAIALGSSEEHYPDHSLSKFGLGLKSASFSQGEVLEIISSDGKNDFKKLSVSLAQIRETGIYGAEQQDLSIEDEKIIASLLKGSGTIIRISDITKVNHPSIKTTLEEVSMKIGVIYYFKMKDNGLSIFLDDDKCEPFDVLFVDEANKNGVLDEHSWDGKTVRWIEKEKQITLDPSLNIKGSLEVTQLPYPPIFEVENKGGQKEAREKYRIGAGNYGYYVYRNGRLLSWCERFNTIPRDQDFYSFRGRICIDETADDIFNIDVKKSRLLPSEEAFLVIDEASDEYKRKSKKAWQKAHAELKRIQNDNKHREVNRLADDLDLPEELPGDFETEKDYLEAESREEEMEEEQKLKDDEFTKAHSDESEEDSEGSDEEKKNEKLFGPEAEEQDKIYHVDQTTDNVLWEPYYDTEKGTCVRINRMHRLSRFVYEDNSSNITLAILFDLLLLNLANTEAYLQKKRKDVSRPIIQNMLLDFRNDVTQFLSKTMRDLGEKLPKE